jgi:hypothetical protein
MTTESETKDIAASNGNAPVAVWDETPTFDELLSDPTLDKVAGADEVFNKENKDHLIRVPFVVVGVSFNKGDQGEFASLTCIDHENRTIVINDGGTGIRRQMVSYLQARGLIDVGTTLDDSNPLDKPFDTWASGDDAAHEGFKIKLLCKRGLRKSDYDAIGEKGDPNHRPAGTTHYLA